MLSKPETNVGFSAQLKVTILRKSAFKLLNCRMKQIAIAGGTGLIGRKLEGKLKSEGYDVLILTRSPKAENHVSWNPSEKQIDLEKLQNVEVIINLCGAGIADKPWSKSRKKILHDSRIIPNEFLSSIQSKLPNLKQFIAASGVNAYGYENESHEYSEYEAYGSDYLSQLVKDWEASTNGFENIPITKMRIAMVLTSNGGAMEKLLKPINFHLGSGLGSGKQPMAWVHIDDLTNSFVFAIKNELDGAYNILNDCAENKTFMSTLSEVKGKKMWLPNVPGFMLKMFLGEMAEMLLKGVKISNQKIKNTGFEFEYSTLKSALENLVK